MRDMIRRAQEWLRVLASIHFIGNGMRLTEVRTNFTRGSIWLIDISPGLVGQADWPSAAGVPPARILPAAYGKTAAFGAWVLLTAWT